MTRQSIRCVLWVLLSLSSVALALQIQHCDRPPSRSSSAPASQQPVSCQPRRDLLNAVFLQIPVVAGLLSASSLSSCPPAQAVAKADFRTKARAEYTNSITASRDTNVSPQEAYDSILKYLPPVSKNAAETKVALDVGAGAGLSTSYLFHDLGYREIDAIDWSGDAWRSNVQETPASVRFFELDDDSFFAARSANRKYDIICCKSFVHSLRQSFRRSSTRLLVLLRCCRQLCH